MEGRRVDRKEGRTEDGKEGRKRRVRRKIAGGSLPEGSKEGRSWPESVLECGEGGREGVCRRVCWSQTV